MESSTAPAATADGYNVNTDRILHTDNTSSDNTQETTVIEVVKQVTNEPATVSNTVVTATNQRSPDSTAVTKGAFSSHHPTPVFPEITTASAQEAGSTQNPVQIVSSTSDVTVVPLTQHTVPVSADDIATIQSQSAIVTATRGNTYQTSEVQSVVTEAATTDTVEEKTATTAQESVTSEQGVLQTAQGDVTLLVSSTQSVVTRAQGGVTSAHRTITSAQVAEKSTQSAATAIQEAVTTIQGSVTTIHGSVSSAQGVVTTTQGSVPSAKGVVTTQGAATPAPTAATTQLGLSSVEQRSVTQQNAEKTTHSLITRETETVNVNTHNTEETHKGPELTSIITKAPIVWTSLPAEKTTELIKPNSVSTAGKEAVATKAAESTTSQSYLPETRSVITVDHSISTEQPAFTTVVNAVTSEGTVNTELQTAETERTVFGTLAQVRETANSPSTSSTHSLSISTSNGSQSTISSQAATSSTLSTSSTQLSTTSTPPSTTSTPPSTTSTPPSTTSTQSSTTSTPPSTTSIPPSSTSTAQSTTNTPASSSGSSTSTLSTPSHITTTSTSPSTTHLPLDSTTYPDSTTTSPLSNTAKAAGLSSGAMAGIIIAVLLAVIVFIIVIILVYRRYQKNKPLLRKRYKNKDSYYQMENSTSYRESAASSYCNTDSTGLTDICLQNPYADLDSLQDTTLKYNGEAGLSRPPSLYAHEEALMFTLSQTNNNATLLRKGKQNGGVKREDSGNNNDKRGFGLDVEGNGDSKVDSVKAVSNLSLKSNRESEASLDLMSEIMGMVRDIDKDVDPDIKVKKRLYVDLSDEDVKDPISDTTSSKSSLCEKSSLISNKSTSSEKLKTDSISQASDLDSVEPGMTSTPFKVTDINSQNLQASSPNNDVQDEDNVPCNIELSGINTPPLNCNGLNSVDTFDDADTNTSSPASSEKDVENPIPRGHYDRQDSITLVDELNVSNASFVTDTGC